MSDGALRHVPFAVLPKPRPDGTATGTEPLLVDEHEVVHLPSASVLAALRREAGARTAASVAPEARHATTVAPEARATTVAPEARATTGVTVFADPVYSPDDPRIGNRPAAADSSWVRLPYSADEAKAIRALAAGGERVKYFTGFDASRERVLSGELAGERILHFASHAVVDTDHPERSGLVLSLFDHKGRPVDGYVRLPELYGLELQAELVVLSACRTALGREFRGEGLVGLTRAFLNAGASRVVVSLWSVEDRATAELMTRFYRGVLGEGLAPAAALRSAQLSLRSEARWRAPYYWAGFVLQGEWR